VGVKGYDRSPSLGENKIIEIFKIFADYSEHDDSGYQNAITLPHVSQTFTIKLFLACCQRQQQQRQV
jgi:hypothetical protein